MPDLIMQGIIGCFEPINLLAMLLAVPLGILIGALPGFGASTGLILILPLTYNLSPSTAFVALTGIYIGAEYGGSISAILLNTPGTGSAVVTCFDGFPLARKGKAKDALFISNIASFSGGLLSGLSMLLFMPLLAALALKFGAGELFVLALTGLFLVGAISEGDIFKNIAASALGVFVTCIGSDAFTGELRYDFGFMILLGGIPFVPVLLGTFSLPHLLDLVIKPHAQGVAADFPRSSLREDIGLFAHYFRKMAGSMKGLLLRSGLCGVLIGMVPGVGGAVATMVAYTSAKKASRHPEDFGKGSEEGVAAPEACDNGVVGGSIIPVLALGIPGSAAAAIFMSAIFLHGMSPGPGFLDTQGNLVYLLIVAVFVCSFIQLALGLFSIGSMANVLRVPVYRLFPVVFAVCCVGAYVVRGLTFDIQLFIGVGLLFYFLDKLGMSRAAFVLGMILGGICESSLMEMLILARAEGGFVPYFLSRHLALVMLAFIALYSLLLLYRFLSGGKKTTASTPAARAQKGSWRGMRGFDLVFALLTSVGACLLFRMSYAFPGDSGIFPRLTLGVYLFCMACLALRALCLGSAYGGPETAPFRNVPWAKLGASAVLMGLYLAGITRLGFYTTTFLFLAFSSPLFRAWESGSGLPRRELRDSLIYACCGTAALYAVFHWGLQTVLPGGWWI